MDLNIKVLKEMKEHVQEQISSVEKELADIDTNYDYRKAISKIKDVLNSNGKSHTIFDGIYNDNNYMPDSNKERELNTKKSELDAILNAIDSLISREELRNNLNGKLGSTEK